MSRWEKMRGAGFVRASSLPARPRHGANYWLESVQSERNYMHYLFRYPAKFHRPIVRWALTTEANKRIVVFDPFSGSGTSNLEALVNGRSSVGLDVDPLACFIARVKTHPLNPDTLARHLDSVQQMLIKISRKQVDLEKLIGADISESQYAKELKGLWTPPLPNITHWFRRYVIVDLARILGVLKEIPVSTAEREFFLACAAAIVRRVSNADPSPVSGLEVTSVQIERNKRREINVQEEFLRKTRSAIHGMRELWDTLPKKRQVPIACIRAGDVRNMEDILVPDVANLLPFSFVVTSPPYFSAVEYSRRHKLEMFWLGLVPDVDSHRRLARGYLGIKHTGGRKSGLRKFGISKLDRLLSRIADKDPSRAYSLERYFAGMERFFCELSHITSSRASVVCVIGDSTCTGIKIPTAEIITNIANDHFSLRRKFSYAIRNHYMQYELRNGNGIRTEEVLMFRRV